MTTPVVLTGFEYGLTPAIAGGGLCNSVWGTSGTTYVIDSAVHRTGSYSLKIAPTAAARGCIGWTVPSTSAAVMRFYVYIQTAPTSGYADLCHLAGAAGQYLGLALEQSTGKFVLINYAAITVLATGPAYETGKWYCVDLAWDISANPNTIACAIDGAEFTGTYAQAGTTSTSIRLGNGGTSGPAYTANFDDVIISLTAGDYPIGPGVVEGDSPISDGTHNAGTNTIEDESGTDIGAVTAYDHLAKVPLNSGTAAYIRQAAIGTTNYAEVHAGTISGSIDTVQGVSALLAYQSATTTANDGKAFVFSSAGSVLGTIYSGDMSEASLYYKSAIIGPPAGGWSGSALTGANLRIGYSSDVSPNPYWNSLMVEYGYAPLTTTIATITPAEASQGQASDPAPVVGLYPLTPSQAFQAQISDAVTACAVTPVTPAEASQSQISDAAAVRAVTPVTAGEASQTQVSDAAVVQAVSAVTPTEASQQQTSDPAAVTAVYILTPAEASQQQQSDPAIINSGTPVWTITPAEAAQVQTSDAAVVSFVFSITPAEASQGQVSDPAPVAALAFLTPAEAVQQQFSDPAVVSYGSLISVTPAEASQSQVADAAVVYAVTPVAAGKAYQAQSSDPAQVFSVSNLTPAEAAQAQLSDAAVVSALAPTWIVAPAEASQGQLSDPVIAHAVYVVSPAEAVQAQISDPAVLSLFGLILPGGRRTYPVAVRESGRARAREIYPTGTRPIHATTTRETCAVTPRGTSSEDD